jgi:hypothetical protein
VLRSCRLALAFIVLVAHAGLALADDPPGISVPKGEVEDASGMENLVEKVSTGDTLTFEGLRDRESVLNYYNGGLGGNGSGSGPAYGVTFSPNALAIIDGDAGGTGNFGGEPTPSTILFFLTGTAIMNVPSGFTTGFSFYYSAINSPGTVTVYSGVNASGSVLASIPLPLTPHSGAPDPTGEFSPLVPVGVSFSGTARSVDFSGTVNQIGFDNITFGSQTPTPGAGECNRNATTLCIDNASGDRRFRATMTFRLPSGSTTNAQAVPLASVGLSRGGAFHFGDSQNPEVLLKVLNGCSLNNQFWVFFAATTNLEYTIVVTDTVTGRRRSFSNSQGNPAQPVQETSAFPCSG